MLTFPRRRGVRSQFSGLRKPECSSLRPDTRSPRCEQSCTELLTMACHRQFGGDVERETFLKSAPASCLITKPSVHGEKERKKEGGWLMERAFRRLRDRFRRRLASIKASVSSLFASLTPPVRGFASQRMCPFCGLITSRSKSSCLECGKSLAPATR